jgi:hypothetical protein
VGVSLQVADVDATARHLTAAGIPARLGKGEPHRVLVSPREAHGIWLEFR